MNSLKIINKSGTWKQKIIYAHRPTIEALTKGLGKKVLKRWWNVIDWNSDKSCVEYYLNGESRKIYGLKGHKGVYSPIIEKDDQIIASYFNNPFVIKNKNTLIKRVVLSEKRGSIWMPLEKPKVIYSRLRFQAKKVEIDKIKEFLLNNQTIGAIFKIKSRPVDPRGRITFGIDSSNHGGVITIEGYGKYAGRALPGEIIVEADEKKRAYFWAGSEDMKKTLPIDPNGHVIAQMKNKTYEIVYRSLSEIEQIKEATRIYGDYIFETAKEEVHFDYWPVIKREKHGNEWKGVYRRIRGNYILITIPPKIDIITRVFGVTHEIHERIKLAEFWLSKEEYERGMNPFAARYITFKPNNGDPWMFFNAKLDDVEKFKMLIKNSLISLKELNKILCNDYLIDYYQRPVIDIVDALKLYELPRIDLSRHFC